MKTVGIIGNGSFGSFVARKLHGAVTLRVHDPQNVHQHLRNLSILQK